MNEFVVKYKDKVREVFDHAGRYVGGIYPCDRRYFPGFPDLQTQEGRFIATRPVGPAERASATDECVGGRDPTLFDSVVDALAELAQLHKSELAENPKGIRLQLFTDNDVYDVTDLELPDLDDLRMGLSEAVSAGHLSEKDVAKQLDALRKQIENLLRGRRVGSILPCSRFATHPCGTIPDDPNKFVAFKDDTSRRERYPENHMVGGDNTPTIFNSVDDALAELTRLRQIDLNTWEIVSNLEGDLTERLRVEGGWLYRNRITLPAPPSERIAGWRANLEPEPTQIVTLTFQKD